MSAIYPIPSSVTHPNVTFGSRGWSMPHAAFPRAARLACAVLLCSSALLFTSVAAQPEAGGQGKPAPTISSDDRPGSPGKVEVQPLVQDDEIQQRLTDILGTTGWFGEPRVTVQDGIAFLKGTAENDESRQWAGDLARNTEGVVAVVNQIEVAPTTVWDFDPIFDVLNNLARGLMRSLPLIVVALVVMLLSWILARVAVRLLRRRLLARTRSQLLREVAARAGGLLIMLAGLYLVLRISGLTQLALTLVGGTGLIGLVLGIAFRDITENFLASVFLSLQQPFRAGDLIEVTGVTGYVQRLTSRTTVLMTLDGNQLQIPNSTIFKSTIRNFTSSPNRREDFSVGIGYDDSITFAQEVALKVLAEHPAVLADPEPLVLVEGLGPSTVNLRVYFWIDGSQHSWVKVKSSVIRFIKRAFQDSAISLPDEAREVTFPNGVPVRMMGGEQALESPRPVATKATAEPETVANRAEAGLQSEAGEIKEQARRSWTPGEDLLVTPPSSETK